MPTYRGTIGNDYMVGSTGADLMIGGLGNDTYVINAYWDTISENPGEGLDTAIVTIASYYLPDNVENARAGVDTGVNLYGNKLPNVLTGAAGDDDLFGGAGDDKLAGGKGADVLDGGTGNDYMAGGTENDSYVVDSLGDIIREYADEGTDEAQIWISGYTLPAHVEVGRLHVPAGTPLASMTLTGNELNNQLVGTDDTSDRLFGAAGNDNLTGLDGNDYLDGGTGADWMHGGRGDDTYVVDDLHTPTEPPFHTHFPRVYEGDQVRELADEGNDTVLVSVSGYTLAANVENGIVNTLAGTTLSGNELANDLIGNGGADHLFGGAGIDHLFGNGANDELDGGMDADWLAGGEGNDTFVLRRGEANGDVLTDFNGAGAFAGDMIRFVGYGPGAYITHSDATHWAIHSADGAVVDIFTVASGAAIHGSDYYFV
jgi:Ca2+-binding RTX toxin-like protein